MENGNSIEEKRIYLLYRRGQTEHINALYEKGELYINPIDFIRTCDENEDRSDVDDGIKRREFLGEVKIKLCEIDGDMDKDGIPMDGSNCIMTEDSTQKGNIYCLSGIYGKHLMGDRNDLVFNTKTFGESLIVIYNPKQFIERVLKELKNKGFVDVRYEPVKYYPHNYSGSIDFFNKHEKFQRQNEFRFFIPNNLNEPIKISIGSLEDIAQVLDGAMLQCTYTDGIEQIITI